MKRVLVIRYGAFGDAIMMTPLLRLLKEDGYHVTVNCTPRTQAVLLGNPHIDRFMVQEDNAVPIEEIDKHWAKISEGYDKVINLSESIEATLLKSEHKPDDFNLPHEQRHAECNVNYYDRTNEIGGYDVKGLNGELYFNQEEENAIRDFRRKHRKKFMVLWSLAGSAYHKAYPYAEFVACGFLDKYPDTMVVTVGDGFCEILEWSHPRTKNYSAKRSIRQAMLLAKYADLVIGSETGILNAAGCFDTPKIVMLSHSSHENLSKYWKNVTPIHADVKCHPCHRLIYSIEACPWDMELLVKAGIRVPICMGKLDPGELLRNMESVYFEWKEIHNGALSGVR